MATVAVFDLDGTVTRGDTFVAYMLFVLLRRPWRLLNCVAFARFAVLFVTGQISNDETKRRLLHAVAGGSTRDDVARYTRDFIRSRVPRMIKPAAVLRILEHAKRGDTLVLATASLDLYAVALASRLGFQHVLATRAAWRDGRLVYGLDGPNLRGEAKREAVEALIAGPAAERPLVVAYSDHHSDLPLLRYADRGIAVDPTRRLAQDAARLGLQIERWTVPPRR